jgi:hypothetical protein
MGLPPPAVPERRKMRWKKMGRQVYEGGESTVYYESESGWYRIESRKRIVPRADGTGVDCYRRYLLFKEEDAPIRHVAKDEFTSLSAAKMAAERSWRSQKLWVRKRQVGW